MADMDEEIIDTHEIEEEIIEEVIEDDSEEITYEQAMKRKEDLGKLSAKISEIKKSEKNKPNKPESSNDLELRLFFIENPDMREDKEGILNILNQEKYKTLTPQEAQILYKATMPKISDNKQGDFSGGNYIPKPKGLAEMSDEDAMKLSPNDYIKRLRLKGELK